MFVLGNAIGFILKTKVAHGVVAVGVALAFVIDEAFLTEFGENPGVVGFQLPQQRIPITHAAHDGKTVIAPVFQLIFLKSQRINIHGDFHVQQIGMHPDFSAERLDFAVVLVHAGVANNAVRFALAIIERGRAKEVGAFKTALVFFLGHAQGGLGVGIDIVAQKHQHFIGCLGFGELTGRDNLVARGVFELV